MSTNAVTGVRAGWLALWRAAAETLVGLVDIKISLLAAQAGRMG